MKKIVLSLAGVMAAVAFAPEASAVPVFARQTGMACSSCHFQHFPALNGFGRAFKQAGYTLMGAQGKVEGEHLSIPDRLNMAVLATQGIDKASNAGSNIFVPGAGGELQLFFGGKVSDFAGFLSEFGTAGAGVAGQAVAGAVSAKIQIMPEVTPGVRAGVTFFSAAQGAAGSYEMLNTGATSIHRLMGKGGSGVAGGTGRANGKEHIAATSARQYVAPEAGGTGVSFNVATENFVGSFAKSTDSGPGTLGGSQGKGLPFKYIRAVGLFDVAGWDTGVGIQNFSGSGSTTSTAAGVVAGTIVSYKATIIDAQMQGELSGMPAGFYASYGRAPGTAAGAAIANNYNAGPNTLTSFNIAGELGVMPGVSTVQVALRSAKTGTGTKDNAFMIGATYELAMNMEVGLHYTTQSGSAWNTVNNPTGVGKNVTTLLLETLF